MKFLLMGKNLWRYAEEDIKEPQEENSKAKYLAEKSEAFSILGRHTADKQLVHIRCCKSAKEIMDKLVEIYESKSLANILERKKAFINVKKDYKDDIRTHCAKVDSLAG